MISALARSVRSARRFGFRVRRNEDGATAVEFALIALPFFTLLIGTMSVSQLYFWVFTAENAVWTASRDMRTGTFQTTASGSPYAGKTGDLLKKEFRNQICLKTVNPADCNANAVVLVQSTSTFASITQPNCRDGSNGLKSESDALAAFDAGAASSIVMVTLCYAWQFGGKLTFLPLGQLSNGAFLVQASAVFETEPY